MNSFPLILITDASPHIRGVHGLDEGYTEKEVKATLNEIQANLFVVTGNYDYCLKSYGKLVNDPEYLLQIEDMASKSGSEAGKKEGRDALALILNGIASEIHGIALKRTIG